MFVGAILNGLIAGCTALFDPKLTWMRTYRFIPGTIWLVPAAYFTYRIARPDLRRQRTAARQVELTREDLLRGEKEIIEFRARRAVRIVDEYRTRLYFLDDEAGTRYFLLDTAESTEPEIGSHIRIERLPTALWALDWKASGDPVDAVMRCFVYHDELEIPETDMPVETSWDTLTAEWLPFKDRPIDYNDGDVADDSAENVQR
jgi:hypothetical protein